MEELDWHVQSPDFNPIQHLPDELERQLSARTYHPASALDLTNALVSKWQQIPAARFKHLMERLEPGAEAVKAAD